MIPLRSSRNLTEEFEAWQRLHAFPSLYKAVADKFDNLFVPTPTPPPQDQLRHASTAGKAKVTFVEILEDSVMSAKPTPVLFFPHLNAAFANLPDLLVQQSMQEGHPPELRMAVECGRWFANDVGLHWGYDFFDADNPLRAEGMDIFYEARVMIEQAGLPVLQFLEKSIDFGDEIFKDEADYKERARKGNLRLNKPELSFSALARMLQV